jgi:phosphoserine aminotransferase
MTERAYNFSPGPAVLPEPVLAEVQRDMLALPGAKASILEISHRSKAFKEILGAAETNLRKLLGIPDSYAVLFLQGGSRLQFSMVPLNLLGDGQASADYLVTGSWSKYALKEAQKEGEVRVAWDGKDGNYSRLPASGEWQADPRAAYLHYTSNETIHGVQFPSEPASGDVPLVCDASSDFLYKPLPIERYGLLYACAQKNSGPAGVTIVIIRKDLLARSRDELPSYLNYRIHADEGSLMNTAPTFAIYVVRLVTNWLLSTIGGLDKMFAQNQKKAKLLYEVVDSSGGFYAGHAQPECRSLMNVVFRLPTDELTKKFCAEAERHNLTDLAGHRSVGGVRASIYNAMPVAGVEALRDFMIRFRNENA